MGVGAMPAWSPVAGPQWGTIWGTITNQGDLMAQLALKAPLASPAPDRHSDGAHRRAGHQHDAARDDRLR